jgi:hypothetical protein
MLSFKQYLREAVTPEMRNRILANVNKSKSARSASNYNENPPLKPLNRQAVPAEEGLPGRGYKGSRFQPDQPVRSTEDRRAGKLSALIAGRKEQAAAAGAAQRTSDVQRGANMAKGILGEKVPVVDKDGKITGTKLKGGVFAALSSYDAARRAQGKAVRKTSYDDKLRQIGVNAVGSMSRNPSASGPNLLRTLGTAGRVGSNVKTGVSNAVSNVGSGLKNASGNLADTAIGGTEHLNTTKIDGTPINPEDKAEIIAQAAIRSKLNSGQAAQRVGMQTTQTQQSGESTAELQQRMSQPEGISSNPIGSTTDQTVLAQERQDRQAAVNPTNYSGEQPKYGSAAEIAKKQEEELAKRMAQIGNRPGFERTKQKYTQTVLAKTNPQAVAPTQQRPANLGAGSMYEEIIKIINRDHR